MTGPAASSWPPAAGLHLEQATNQAHLDVSVTTFGGGGALTGTSGKLRIDNFAPCLAFAS